MKNLVISTAVALLSLSAVAPVASAGSYYDDGYSGYEQPDEYREYRHCWWKKVKWYDDYGYVHWKRVKRCSY